VLKRTGRGTSWVGHDTVDRSTCNPPDIVGANRAIQVRKTEMARRENLAQGGRFFHRLRRHLGLESSRQVQLYRESIFQRGKVNEHAPEE